MTTNANKHGLRAAATERRNRHAQRTPLPPKPGVVEAAREELDSALDPETLTPEEVLRAALVEARGTKGRSMGKAQAFAQKAATAGWSTVLDPQGGDAVELTATRGAETIVQAWSGGLWQYPASFYGYGDRNTKPRNASGAAKLLTRSVEDAAAEAAKVHSNRNFRKSEPKDITERLEVAQRHLPFDPDLATDEEITGVIAGQAVVWYNRLSRKTESAIVGRKGARLTVTPTGERVLTFCCPATGYRSCLVTALLKVGRGTRATTKGDLVETVEVA